MHGGRARGSVTGVEGGAKGSEYETLEYVLTVVVLTGSCACILCVGWILPLACWGENRNPESLSVETWDGDEQSQLAS